MASTTGNQEIARRYAVALLSLAETDGQTDRVAADAQRLKKAVSEVKEFSHLIKITAVPRAAQGRAVLSVASALDLGPLTQKFLGTLAANRRLAALPAILDAVEAAIALRKGEVTAHVVSAKTLDAKHTQAIAAALGKTLGKTVRIHATEDASIMGGLVVRVGSRLIDGSVRAKLERLSRALTSSASTTDKKRMKEVA